MKPGIYPFADCVVDREARELRRGGELLVLPPKVFDCLVYLIEHRDRAVGRDELIAAVWGKVDVTDTLLGQTVLKARRAVGDTGSEQNAIRTVPRFGYRWIAAIGEPSSTEERSTSANAEVVARADDARRDPDATTGPVVRRQRLLQRVPIFWAISLAAFALAVTVAAYVTLSGSSGDRRSPRVSAMAHASGNTERATLVMPVEVVAGSDWAWLRLGLMDLIANRLRAAGQPVVPSDNVVALTREYENHAPPDADALLDATGAQSRVAAVASQADGEWLVRLSLRDMDGGERDVEARAADATGAARAATDRLLALLGKPVPRDPDALDLSAGELLSRVEADLLTDQLDRARETIENASAEIRSAPEARLRMAQIDFRAGRFDQALQRLDALRKETDAESDPLLLARILNGAGAVHVRLDRGAEAERDFSTAIGLVQDARQPATLGQAYTGRGISHALLGRYEAAVSDFARARVALEMAGDTLALARVEANEGIIDAKRGHHAQALTSLLRAAGRFERFGAVNELVSTLANASQSQLALLQPSEALATCDRAWPLLGRLENPYARDAIRIERAAALGKVGRVIEARALLQDVLAASAAAHPPLLARARIAAAELDLADGEAETAAALARSAVEVLDLPDYDTDRAVGWLTLVRALRMRGEDAAAAAEVERMGAWAAQASAAGPPVYADLARAENAWTEGGDDTAREAYERALATAERSAVPADLAVVLVSYGNSLIGGGQLTRATRVVGQVARWSEHDFACALLRTRLYHALGEREAWQTALRVARALAGERRIPPALITTPDPLGAPEPPGIRPSNQ